MDKKDLEELKEWKEKNLNYIETYGVDIYKKGSQKKKTEKIINAINKIVKVILIIFCILIIFGTGALLIYRWNIIYDSLHINPKETLEGMYKINLVEVSKNIDSHQNGSYIFELKDNSEIRFNVIVEWASMNEDYADNCQKYYFEHWENTNKDLIQTSVTYYDEIILKYEQYIQITGETEIEYAVKLMYDLVKFAGNKFSPDWELYLKIGENVRIYPFDYYNIDLEKSINKVQSDYENLTKNP